MTTVSPKTNEAEVVRQALRTFGGRVESNPTVDGLKEAARRLSTELEKRKPPDKR